MVYDRQENGNGAGLADEKGSSADEKESSADAKESSADDKQLQENY